jgi:hypothetical protein
VIGVGFLCGNQRHAQLVKLVANAKLKMAGFVFSSSYTPFLPS